MSAYLVATITIHNRQTYGQYEAGFMEIFSQYQGKMLAVDDSTDVLEGDWDFTRTVLLEFPSAEEARAWFHSDAYQDLARFRREASVGNIALLNGLDLQPAR